MRIGAIGPGEAARLVPLNAIVQAVHVERRPDLFRADAGPAEIEAWFRGWLAHPSVTALVAGEGADLGYLVFEVQNRPGTAMTLPERRGFLHHIAVIPEARRQGVGTALIDEMKARLRAEGIARWATSYWLFNQASAALMAKAGAEPGWVFADAHV